MGKNYFMEEQQEQLRTNPYIQKVSEKAIRLYKYDEARDVDKNKVMKVNENREDRGAESHANIQGKQGILNRQIRSIQTEGHFGDIKENNHFRRFNYRNLCCFPVVCII